MIELQLEAGTTRLAPVGARAGWPVRHVTPGRVALLALIFAAAVPQLWVETAPVLSPFRRSTGLPDPGCGMTRSLVALAHGDLEASLFFHPLGVVVAALLVALVLVDLNPWRVSRSMGHPCLAALRSSTALLLWLISGPTLWIGLAVFVVVWLVRLPLFLAGIWVY